jgi:chromosome partitioning protein
MKTTVIAIYNPKGGVGKTETAVALATGIAAKHAHEGRNEPVLLVDLDRQGNCAHRLRVHEQTYDPNTNPDGVCISALLTGRARIEDSILQDVRPNLDLLPSTPEISIAVEELQDADRRAMTHGRTPRGHIWLDDILSQRLAPALGIYRYIIIDCPPDMDRLKRPLFRFADHVIAPTQLSSIPVRMTARNTKEIVDAKEHAQLLLVLPTMTSPVSQGQLAYIEERILLEGLLKAFGKALIAEPIPRSIHYSEAAAAGQSIFEYNKETGRHYGRLVERVTRYV